MIGEISGRGNLWEKSGQRTAWSEKCTLGKCDMGKCQSGNCPTIDKF